MDNTKQSVKSAPGTASNTTSNAIPNISNAIPNIRFSHLGICVCDLEKMQCFYTDILGFTVTDSGHTVGLDVIFMSRDPNEHHQIVLTNGRPQGIPANTANTMFGPIINQISFQLDSLQELRGMHTHLTENYAADYTCVNHGTAWSVYFHDPEGNPIEVFVNSDWYAKQPIFTDLDLSLDDDEILAATEALCQSGEDFKPASQWRAEIATVMGVALD